ncbi:hypothetical protein [Pantoea sp. A4]|uniref:hypothetical protein n=1 Tax=Pantoea sp. A4 TaxID=1225184 RepID=UPI0003789EF6|nr:hypothetical protein [Pantoea sp. A4]
MNVFLTDLVSLNKVILSNAREQFTLHPEVSGRATRALPTDLIAAVETERVSGEKRYKISTHNDPNSWTLALDFALDQAIESTPYVVLSYDTFGKPQEMVFNSVQQAGQPTQYHAQLDITELAERDALLRALSVYESQTTLVVVVKSENGLLNTITDPAVFYFAPDYYPYIYQGLLPPGNRLELILYPIPFGSKTFNYYQDYVRKNYLYYLPDEYLLATDAENDDKPLLSLTFNAPQGATSLDEVRVQFDYFVVPKVQQARIVDASVEFKHDQPTGRLLPFATADKSDLWLTLPDGRQQETEALIDLQSGIADSFSLPYHQFSPIWEAFFDTAPQSTLLKGYLATTFTGFPPEHIPVRLALDSRYKDQVKSFIREPSMAVINTGLLFKTLAATWNPNGPKPIASILVSVQRKTIELTAGQQEAPLNYQTPVLDLILHPEKPPVYYYDVEIHYADGSIKKMPNQEKTVEVIYVP